MKKDSAYLHHISDAISAIEEYTRDITREEFFEKRIIQDAVILVWETIHNQLPVLKDDISKILKQINDEI